MPAIWTHKGKHFGYRDGNSLYTRHGVEVGRFIGDEVFGKDGRYLGEERNGRLITARAKLNKRGPAFAPRKVIGRVGMVGYVGWVNVAGYDDFPGPETFT